MRKSILFLVCLFLLSSCYSPKANEENNTVPKKDTSTSIDNSIKADRYEKPNSADDTIIYNGIKCYVIKRDTRYSRVVTERKTNSNDLAKIADSLKLASFSVKFYLPKDANVKDWAEITGKTLFLYDQNKIIEGVVRNYNLSDKKQSPPISNVDNNNSTQITSVINSKSKCTVMAEEFIKNRLKNPRSAHFYGGVVHEPVNRNTVKLLGKFSATNDFGGEKETHYRIIMKFNGNDWSENRNWEIISIDFE